MMLNVDYRLEFAYFLSRQCLMEMFPVNVEEESKIANLTIYQ